MTKLQPVDSDLSLHCFINLLFQQEYNSYKHMQKETVLLWVAQFKVCKIYSLNNLYNRSVQEQGEKNTLQFQE